MKFDAIVGALEAFMMEDDFASTQAAFCRAECAVFEDTDENKLEYTPIFERYVDALETAIEAHLASAVPGFDMLEFAEMLEARRETEALDGDAFELLATLSDFDAFKELMLAHKAEREARDARDSAGLSVGSVGSVGDGDGDDGGDGSASNRHRRGGLLELGVGVGFGVSAEAAAAPAAGTDEQTDGEERPDLDDALIVTNAGAGGE
jgi:ADP-ribosylation factor 2-binding protein